MPSPAAPTGHTPDRTDRPLAAHFEPDSSITQLLQSWSAGDRSALDDLIPRVYDELRRIARNHLRQEREGHTLQSTALVHEAFMRLAQQERVEWTSRSNFYGWMSHLMRRILVEHARIRHAAKRGAGQQAFSLDALREAVGDALEPTSSDALLQVVELDQALRRMERLDPRQGRIVELRFFGGLSVDETAQALAVSPATVKREWSTARAWLLHQMDQAPAGESQDRRIAPADG